MKVKLVAKTVPVVEGLGTGEELLSYAARVSNPKNQLNTDTADKLLGYCWRHKHVSIFETASLTMEIETSRAISAQMIRHRSFTFQEFSQRYQSITEFEEVLLRKQDTKNRQNSTDDLSSKDKTYFKDKVEALIDNIEDLYKQMLYKGVAKECARMILPMTTQTRLYMTGNIRSWIGYCIVRCQKDTQLEHRKVADECWKIVRAEYPAVAKFVEADYDYLKEIE